MWGTFAPKLFFVRHWGALANKLRMISEQFYYWAFLVRQTSAWATILRMESETYPPSAHLRFFVRFLERHGDWMASEIRTTFYIFVILLYFVRQGDPFGEQNTNAGHFCPEVVFCSPFRRHGVWNTSEKIQSPNDRFYCVYQVPVCECVFHSGRLRYAFPPNDICALAPKELRIRPEWFTHSPRRCYTFSPKVLRIRPEGVTHSSGRTKYDHSCY